MGEAIVSEGSFRFVEDFSQSQQEGGAAHDDAEEEEENEEDDDDDEDGGHWVQVTNNHSFSRNPSFQTGDLKRREMIGVQHFYRYSYFSITDFLVFFPI